MHNKILKNILIDLNEAFTNKWAYSCAVYLSELLEAEEKQLISSRWRQQVNVEEIETLIATMSQKVEEDWFFRFRKLERILVAREKLLYEETMLILSSRSGLELGSRYIDPKHLSLLHELDKQFRLTLEENADEVKYCQSRKKVSFDQYFEQHWWWHSL